MARSVHGSRIAPFDHESTTAAITAEEANKASIRRLFSEILSGGRVALFDELVDPRFRLYAPTLPQPGEGAEAAKQFVTELRTGFPDLEIEIESLIADGEWVAARWRSTQQTHLGPYRGLPPTGRAVRMSGIDMFRFGADGRVLETWLEFDQLGGVQQMGAFPPDDAGPARRIGFTLASFIRLAFLSARHSFRQRGKNG